MTEAAVKSNQALAAQLYERGVGAARGGQRRMAAVLLARAVQYDPQHEQAWLWLSGVIDDPAQVAFCLRSVLELNPANQRARRGLEWLERRAPEAVAAPVAPAAAPAAPRAALAPAPAIPDGHDNGWWVGWRRAHRELSRARTLLWLMPVLLLLLTLGLNIAIRDALDRRAALAAAAHLPPTSAALAPPAAAPTPIPILALVSAEEQQAAALAYISAITPARERLRAADAAYRQATSQPGNSAVVHAAAARALREEVSAAIALFETLEPPPAARQAHADYLAGLRAERAALDDMIEFYGSFRVQLANRAAIRMDEAARLLARARAAFDRVQSQPYADLRFGHTAR